MTRGVFKNNVLRIKRLSEARKNQGNFRLGIKHRPETKQKIRRALIGHPVGADTRRKISGKNHWNWQGGKATIARRIRVSAEYKEWRAAVFKRDDHTCQICGKRGGKLEADHIKPFAIFPELRFDVDNGRTLCEDCHRKTPTWGKNKKHYD